MNATTEIVPVAAEHHDGWRRLFMDYCMDGGIEVTPPHLDRVWGWLASADAQTRGLVALSDGEFAGLAHFRVFERPITGTTGLWIDDLYVEPMRRGRGFAGALVESVRLVARSERHDVVRWTTRATNVGARRLYDQIATQAPVVVYNATP